MARWRHRILDSRVGLRVLGLFVLAAGAPLLLLVLLSQRAVDDTLAHGEALMLASTAKSTSLQTLERLRLAQQSLLIAHAAPTQRGDAGQPTPLQAALDVDAQGRQAVLFGAPHAAVLRELPGRSGAAQERLRLVPDDRGAAHVVLRVAREGGGVRLGLVDPAFLWDGAEELPPGVWQCALDAGGVPLFCSAPEAAALATAQFHAAERGVRSLFLAADFGAPDWHFVAGLDERQADNATQALRRTLPIAAAAALLLAVLLALVQLRRTMTPLQALAVGAREIAQGRFAARLNVRSRDEFGELADAFNHMAEHLQAQFGELETLAAIDREIVDRVDLAGIGIRIVEQLRRILPQRAVGLAYLAAHDAQHLVCVAAAPGAAGTRSHRLRLEPQALARLAQATEWLPLTGLTSIPGFGHGGDTPERPATALPLRWRGRCFGFVAVGAGSGLDADLQRQLLNLRNRAAIAASAVEREQHLLYAAEHDSVTGLLNRHGLDTALRTLLAAAGPGDQALAVLFVDLDRFKAVNDGLGHAAGDQALHQVAERLRSVLPENGLAARPAGDEFVVLLPRAGERDAATAIAQTICDSLAQPMLIGEALYFLHASVGVVLATDAQASADALLRSADQAMYTAKRAGGGRYALFDQRLDTQSRRRAWIEADLPRAAERGELRLLYQPRLERHSRRVTSVEALIRWEHPQHGACSPGEFIPVAEQSELIEHLGRWVIETACAQARAWRDAGIADLRVAVNLSARQIGSKHLLPDLEATLARHGLHGTDLEVEITESLLIEQTEATVDRLHALRRLGMTIALDDFGTGYSSMSYLRSLPIDVLKIDRAFVKDLGHDRSARAVANAIVALASSLGMRTVAEGVETFEQWKALERLRCDEVQGFLFSHPLEADAVADLIRAAHPSAALPPNAAIPAPMSSP